MLTLGAIEVEARAFRDGAREATALPFDEWDALRTLYFVRSLGAKLDVERMAALDEARGFTSSTNSEILAAWLELAVRSSYHAADEALANFLKGMGRRKFLKPLYAALAETPAGLERARKIYAEARPRYHSIARGTIEELLGS